jgi:hypothetical protein
MRINTIPSKARKHHNASKLAPFPPEEHGCANGDRDHCELEQTREHFSALLRLLCAELYLYLDTPCVEEPFGGVTTIPVSLTTAAKLGRTDIHLFRELLDFYFKFGR